MPLLRMLIRSPKLYLAALFASLACSKDAPPGGSISATPARARRASGSSASVAYDTAGCGAIPKTQFPEPEQVVSEWVRRDTLGYFMTPDDKLFELTACPGHLGGGDEIIIAVDPHIERLAPVADSAAFLITYRRFGRVQSDSTGNRETFITEPGTDSIRVMVVHTPWGWRFPFDVANPHLSPRVALEKIEAQWNPNARDSLKALAERLTHS